MYRRLIAWLLAALLMASALGAWAEPEGIAGDGEIELDGIEEVIDAGELALSLDGLSENAFANDNETALQPTVLVVRKSGTQKVILGVDYQITVPGKTIKSCKSDSKKIATVTNQGLIHTLKAGETKITVTPTKGDRLKLKLKVIDPKVPTGVVINEGAKATLVSGQTMLLTAAVSPATAPQEVTWKSGNAVVASVDADGLVTALTPGQTTITAATGNGLKAQLALKVRRTESGHYMIAHAMGGIDGYDYANCLEGFQQNYDDGFRIFEADIELTSDNRLVLWSDWHRRFCSEYSAGRTPTHDEFMASRIYDEYTPLDIEALLELMHEYPDVRIITDTHHYSSTTVKRQFKAIVSAANQLGIPEVLDQFIVGVYAQDMFKVVDDIHHFREYMMNMYKVYSKPPTKSKLQKLASFCKKNGIDTLAMYAKWWNPKYTGYVKSYGVDLVLYTVNDSSAALEYFDDGVNGLYTDDLPPVE